MPLEYSMQKLHVKKKLALPCETWQSVLPSLEASEASDLGGACGCGCCGLLLSCIGITLKYVISISIARLTASFKYTQQ